MGQVTTLKRRHFSGVEADMASVVSPAIGDKYFASDTLRSFFYTGAAWKAMTVEKAIDHTWEGDNTNNREIDLGDDYDFILIHVEEDHASNSDHPGLAIAFRSLYGLFYNLASGTYVRHLSMATTNVNWQGKMFGGDITKIKLGSTGNAAIGLNLTGQTYRLIGFKFQAMI